MRTISISAHYDGRQIWLDESVELQPNTQLLVTILEGEKATAQKENPDAGAHDRLAFSFEEESDEYPLHLIR